jgi:hypothetical protein
MPDDYDPTQTYDLELFRAGTHTASNGMQITFSRDDLQQAVDTYNPDYYKAPLVLGHPKDNTPAYGWFDQLKLVGDTLVGTVSKVSEGIINAVRNGHYGAGSSSFYQPDAPSNPYKGNWSFRHFGLLGAMPPAVKGLKPIEFVEFSTDEEGTVSFQTSDFCGNDGAIAQLFSRLRDWIIDKYDLETADRVLDPNLIGLLNMPMGSPIEMELSTLNARVAALEADETGEKIGRVNPFSNSYQYSEMNTIKQMKGSGVDANAGADATGLDQARREEIMGGAQSNADEAETIADAPGVSSDELMGTSTDKETDKGNGSKKTADMSEAEAEAQEWKQKAIAAQAALKRHETTSFCEELVREGRLNPGQMKPRTIEFGEGSEEMDLVSFMASLNERQETFFKTYLKGQPMFVSYGEIAKDDEPKGGTVNFEAAPGFDITPEAQQEWNQVVEYCQAKGLDLKNSAHLKQALRELHPATL